METTLERCDLCAACLKLQAMRRKARKRLALKYKDGSKKFNAALTARREELERELPCTTVMILRWAFLPEQQDQTIEEVLYLAKTSGRQQQALVELIIALAKRVFVIESMARDRLNELRSVVLGAVKKGRTT